MEFTVDYFIETEKAIREILLKEGLSELRDRLHRSIGSMVSFITLSNVSGVESTYSYLRSLLKDQGYSNLVERYFYSDFSGTLPISVESPDSQSSSEDCDSSCDFCTGCG